MDEQSGESKEEEVIGEGKERRTITQLLPVLGYVRENSVSRARRSVNRHLVTPGTRVQFIIGNSFKSQLRFRKKFLATNRKRVCPFGSVI